MAIIMAMAYQYRKQYQRNGEINGVMKNNESNQ
jgi:hypothetical protein